MPRIAALFIAMGGAIVWAVLSILPPAPLTAEAPRTVFSAARAMADIEAISRAPRPVGSGENARVRRWLAARLRSIGAIVGEQAAPLPAKSLERLGKWSGRKQSGVVAHNLIGVIPGRDGSGPAILVMAHLDSVWGSPGAADDAMGVAAALETARALRSRGSPARDLILLFTDSEELGLDGAEAFFAGHPLAKRVGVIVNIEARGAGGRANMFETGPGNGALMRLYAERVDRPATNSLSVLIYDLMPNHTDYSVAKKRGIAGFNLATLDRAYAYHSPMATPGSIDPASVQDMGDQVLALASTLAFADALPPRTADAAFADLLGRMTIVYPAAGGWALLLGAAALIGTVLWRTRPAPRAIGRGMIVIVALLLHGVLLLTTLNALSGSGGANYYDRLAALPRLEAVSALGVAALLMLLPLFRRQDPRLLATGPAMALMWAGLLAGGPLILLVLTALLSMAAACFLPPRQNGPGSLGMSAALLLFGAAGIVQFLEPTAGPLLQWPLLLAAIAMAGRTVLPPLAGLAVTALCAAAGIGHLLAQAHFIFLGIGADLPAVTIALLFAALPLILPLWPDLVPRWIPGTALAAALIGTLWIRLDPIAPSVPAYSLAESAKTRD